MYKGNNGFKNKGNSCYINSALQCLSHINILSNNNFHQQIIKYKKNDSPLINEWFNIQNKIYDNNNNESIDTGDLIQIFTSKCIEKNYEINITDQNDVSEFLLYFFEFLHEEISRKVSMNVMGDAQTQIDKLYKNNRIEYGKNYKDYSYIIEQFYSSEINFVECPNCKKIKDNHSFNPFIVLHQKPGYNTLNDYLDDHIKKDTLDDDNKLKCENCELLVNSNKMTYPFNLSSIIIFVLQYDLNELNELNMKHLIKLDMKNYCLNYNKESTEYELSGVCIHIGNSEGGHYYSICKNNYENKWKKYDDESVSDINENDCNIRPYCLFYKRV